MYRAVYDRHRRQFCCGSLAIISLLERPPKLSPLKWFALPSLLRPTSRYNIDRSRTISSRVSTKRFQRTNGFLFSFFFFFLILYKQNKKKTHENIRKTIYSFIYLFILHNFSFLVVISICISALYNADR